MKFKLFSAFIIVFLLGTHSCTDTEEIIPQVSFFARLKFIATDPAYNQENPFVVKIDSYNQLIGNAGVVIYRLSDQEYYVFDLMCPNEKSRSSLVEVTEDGYCKCPTCGSLFAVSIPDGALLDGPSHYGLYPYNAEVVDGSLQISN
ncbi:Rieske (2Fe-2S) protein [Saccharicrinis fermentans]|uniref:Rieske domain-containing protein n=1 Tax=Saccharicrinis fermentans DSM 9555 = JCM 21142 TaxID=869213 RepID=W7Y4A0_9BACT|nr:Rieske 2Fe-2S domain-containing protein [Saccharicrinis fermentans]GAF02403.1 hypothetical protein JCM21142_31037 [Saccharicrinis fermentans DSM 9555 = JCM 21142]